MLILRNIIIPNTIWKNDIFKLWNVSGMCQDFIKL